MTTFSNSNTGVEYIYETGAAPIKAAIIKNPRGYLDVTATINTTRNGRRVKLATDKGAIFVHVDSIPKLLEAVEMLEDYGVDSSAA